MHIKMHANTTRKPHFNILFRIHNFSLVICIYFHLLENKDFLFSPTWETRLDLFLPPFNSIPEKAAKLMAQEAFPTTCLQAP